jgi:2-polyprenyl-6-hydroxyphenyl methylase/3-demethylubiquinone-9 3-methyltransferase
MSTAGETGSPRFEFGRNWSAFLARVDENGIRSAIESLCELLDVQSLRGQRFLDVGCGSGLSSLAARRLGAEVRSFDFDEQSVWATQALKERFASSDEGWRIEHGSVLDAEYMKRIGCWDIVYSWGVLHHTGAMWTAIDRACDRVADDGQLALAIYNDQGWQSRIWHGVKTAYVKLPVLRPLLLAGSAAVLWGPSLLRAAAGLRFRQWWAGYSAERGMSRWNDLIDWVGGYPFEVASPDAVIRYCEQRGFRLERAMTTTRLGCNQFAFRRDRVHAVAGAPGKK